MNIQNSGTTDLPFPMCNELPLRDSHYKIFRDSVSFIRIMGDFVLYEIYYIEDLLHLQSLLKLFKDIFLELLGMHLQITLQITLVAKPSLSSSVF